MFLPKDFIENMRNLIPEESDAFIKAMEEEPSVAIKINRRKAAETAADKDYLYPDGEQVKWCESGKYLADRPLFTLNPLLHAGVFYVQDASSMIYETIARRIVEVCDKAKGLSVLDLCAAPGGKTTSLINALPDSSLVVANEFMPQRAVILRENLSKWGYPDTIVTNSPTERFASLPETFNIVAVDAPCSGEGMMRKDEKAVEQWNDGLSRQCRKLQEEIVGNAVKTLKNGGFLIYSTCTFNRLENEEMAEFIVKEFGLTPFCIDLPEEWNIHKGIGTDIPCFRFMPHRTKGEGLFVAVFRKEDSYDSISAQPAKSRKNKFDKKGEPLPDISSWTSRNDRLFRIKDTVYAISPELDDLRRRMEENIKILAAGTPVADLKGKAWAPRVELALSSSFNESAFPLAEVSEEEALKFLRAEAMVLDSSIPKGYVCLKFQGHPLGFVKNIGNRANNLYPSEWRIRLR